MNTKGVSDRRKDHLNQIIDGLYLGDYKAAYSEEILSTNGITHILIVGSGMEPKFPDKYTYKFINGSDSDSTFML